MIKNSLNHLNDLIIINFAVFCSIIIKPGSMRISPAVIFFISGFVFFACHKSNSITPVPTAENPAIISIQPTAGPYGTIDTIIGTNFVAGDSVKVNGAAAIIQKIDSDTIIVVIPKRAGTGPVTVIYNTGFATGPVFNYVNTVSVITIAGDGNSAHKDGKGVDAEFTEINAIVIDKLGNLYVADGGSYSGYIRKITPDSVVTTIAGIDSTGFRDGPGAGAAFYAPAGMAIDANGDIILADLTNNRIRRVTPSGVVTTIAGNGVRGFADGPASSAEFNNPNSVAVDNAGNIYVAETETRIRKIAVDGTVSTFAGSSIAGSLDGALGTATLNWPAALIGNAGNNLYFSTDFYRIRQITAGGMVTTIAAQNGSEGYLDGPVATAEFRFPDGLALDGHGNLYVAELGNDVIRMISSDRTTVSTLAGSGVEGYMDGPAAQAQFFFPVAVAVDLNGDIYVGDQNNSRIRKILIE
jgi:sugar lactone lactonase YvrE